MQIFRLSRPWRVISYLFCVVFMCAAMCLLYLATAGEVSSGRSLSYHAGAIGLLLLTWYIFRDTRYGKLVVNEGQITLVSPFRSISLPLSEIKGFRFTDNYIIVFPELQNRRKIRISTYLEGQSELREWLYEHCSNLDEAETDDEVHEILQNEELGLFHESRLQRWYRAREIAKWTNRLGWVVTLWILFFPKPYSLAILAGMILPVVAIGLAYSYRGLMKGGDRDTSAYPSVAEAFVIPGMALMLRALFDYEILFYKNAWTPVLALTIMLFLVYHFPTGGFSPKKVADYIFLAVFPIFTFAYSLGSVILINCAYDESQPSSFHTRVISKHFTKGKTTTYYVKVEPWEGLDEPEDVEVSRPEYERAEASDRVTIIQHKGALNIPWIRVSLEPRQESVSGVMETDVAIAHTSRLIDYGMAPEGYGAIENIAIGYQRTTVFRAEVP